MASGENASDGGDAGLEVCALPNARSARSQRVPGRRTPGHPTVSGGGSPSVAAPRHGVARSPHPLSGVPDAHPSRYAGGDVVGMSPVWIPDQRGGRLSHDRPLIPMARASQILTDRCGMTCSHASVLPACQISAHRVRGIGERINEAGQSRPVVPLDETGCHVEPSCWWVHVARAI